jgi:signal transduction histidine kinase
MSGAEGLKDELQSLAVHLTARRPEILARWHRLVDVDEQLTTASSISRTQFYDHIPQVLEAYEHRLRAEHVADKQAAAAEQRKSAAEHGLHRWQQGYNQLETMREWAHLQLCLLDELEVYEAEHAGLDPGVMRTARRALVRLCGDGVCESAARYARSQQSEAASRLHELEQAVVHLQSMERERAERWREAAHDLRSTVGVVTNVAAVLTRTGIPETARVAMSQALQRGTAALRDLLVDLMDLSRLEAGQERRNIASFDVAKMLREFSEPLRALAAQRNLFFRTDGVESLLIEGDSAKVQRIAQNLVMNAFRATVQGGLRLTWEERNADHLQQWILCVQDTGPGLAGGSIAPLERALQRATEESHDVEAQAKADGDVREALAPAPTLQSRSPSDVPREVHGEGIGLAIVKRLCELLDASLELETASGEGTTFRVIFPRRYTSQKG